MVNFRARIAKQGDNRIIIVPAEYRNDVEGLGNDLLEVVLTPVKGRKENKH